MKFFLDHVYKYLALIIIGVSVFLIFVGFADLKLNTADASIYLSIAENIAHHKGFVVSYNLCQCFNTLYHSIWSYYQPIYPIFASLFIDHGGVIQVVKVNIVLFAVNVMLIFYMMQELMPTGFNILFMVFLIFSSNFYLSALYAWTEQLHFFCFIVSFILFFKFKERPGVLFWLGVFNGSLMLLRVAHLYNFVAFLPVLFLGKDHLSLKIKRALSFISGFVLLYGLYQLYCLVTYHTCYPSYARPGASYGHARFDTCIIYDPNKVGMQVSLGPFLSLQHLTYIGQHLRDFHRQLPLLVLPALFYYFLPVTKRVKGGFFELCLLQSIITIVSYSLTFYWLTYSFDSLRYSMIPFVLISMAGWYCLYQGLALSESWGKRIVGVIIFITLISPPLERFINFRENLMMHHPWQRPYSKDLLEGYEWIDKNLPEDILVASNEDQQAYFMHRPFISTPVGQSFTCANLALYNRIYLPDYYLLSSAIADKCFTPIPHSIVFSNKTFRLLKIAKRGR